jgi:tetratricopeptide (TPR) repeat protein
MWEVFRASNAPRLRHRAAEEAFARWGLELMAFRSPTFELLLPPPGWQLLYKAGDQELHQRLEGAHAEPNFARAATWARNRGVEVPADPRSREFAQAMTRAGAETWLRAPYQQRRRAAAEAALASGPAAERARGFRARGRLLFDAGDYSAALADFARAAALSPTDPRPHYYGALSSLMLGRPADARRAVEAAAPQAGRLSRAEAERLQLLGARLAAKPHLRAEPR